MRNLVLMAGLALAFAANPAAAAENFIPLGQDYGLENDRLPPLDTDQERFNAQADIYQSEVYNRELQQKQFDSRIFNLLNEQNPGDITSPNLDY